MRKLREHKGVEIIEANACKGHINMLVGILAKLSISVFMGYLKEKSFFNSSMDKVDIDAIKLSKSYTTEYFSWILEKYSDNISELSRKKLC